MQFGAYNVPVLPFELWQSIFLQSKRDLQEDRWDDYQLARKKLKKLKKKQMRFARIRAAYELTGKVVDARQNRIWMRLNVRLRELEMQLSDLGRRLRYLMGDFERISRLT